MTFRNEDIARFDAWAQDWWRPDGPVATLHAINPVRIEWLLETITQRFSQLEGLSILDIGCGAGLLAEPLSRLGARVTGLDPAPRNIEAARAHAEATGADLTYRLGIAQDLVNEGAKFDVVLAMEVVEHVEDVSAFVASAAALVAPGGLLCLSTLNRTAKSWLLAIVGAEYVLHWLPKGTHKWECFVTPLELTSALRRVGFVVTKRQGLCFDPLRRQWRLGQDMAVNYCLAAVPRGMGV